MQSGKPERRLLVFNLCLLPVLLWSWYGPYDRFTWWLEVAPVFVGLPLMYATARRFPLSSFLLLLIWLHCVVLLVGGHYTYAKVPLFDWLRELTEGTRNNYDKLGHFVQGFVPAILSREILLRNSPLKGSRWLGFLVVSVCLAFSALYELIEWGMVELTGSAADDFMGTQGYAWDAQSDMALALLGALVAVFFFTRLHDRSLSRLGGRA